MNITVITNSILVFNELQYSSGVKIILLGGTFDINEYEVNGILSSMSMNYIRADQLFMGASSFDEIHGFTTAFPAVDLYLTCLKSCLESCVLVDSSKYKKGGTAITARPDQINYLFTDNGLNRQAIDTFREKGVKVIISDI
jgi:DeoR/GlpR family transcriptional regulator of sugar metabolism